MVDTVLCYEQSQVRANPSGAFPHHDFKIGMDAIVGIGVIGNKASSELSDGRPSRPLTAS